MKRLGLQHLATLVVVLGVLSQTAHAQVALDLPVAAGARVRVVMRSDESYEGVLMHRTVAGVTIIRGAPGLDTAYVLAWDRMRRMDERVVYGHSLARTLMGGASGLAVGAALGLAYSRYATSSCSSSGGHECGLQGLGGVVFVPIGGVVGMLVGWSREPHGWETRWNAETH